MDKNILKWLIAGLFIRIALIPIATHSDLLAITWMSHYISLGHYDLYSYLYDTFNISVVYPPLIHFLNAFFLSVLSFFQLIEIVPWNNPSDLSYLNRSLFLFKLPYLMFDLFAGYLLMQIVEVKQKEAIFILWILSPVTIFSSYMMGQFDIIPTFFVILALYYAKKYYDKKSESCYWGIDKDVLKSILSLGVGISFKVYPVFLLPFFSIILAKKQLKDSLKLILIGSIPYVIGLIIFASPSFFLGGSITLAGSTLSTQQSEVFNFSFDVGHQNLIYVLFAGYFMLLFYLFYIEPASFTFNTLWQFCFIALTLIFTTIYWHPQWYIFIIPFIMLAIGKQREVISLYFVQMLLFAVLLIGWGNSVGIGLFSPIAPFLGKLPGLDAAISQIYPFERIYGIFFTLFVVVSLGMIILTFKKTPLSNCPLEGAQSKKIGKNMFLVLIIFLLMFLPGLIGYLYTKDVSPYKEKPDSDINADENTIVGQSFVSHYSNLRMIVVRTSGDSTVKNVFLGLRSDPSSTIDIVNTTGRASVGWGGDKYYKFDFSPLLDSKNKSYYFVITTPEPIANLKLRSISANSYQEGGAYINGKPVEGDLMFTTYYKAKFSEIFEDERNYIINIVSQDKGFFAFYFVLIIVLLYCLRWIKVKM